MKYWLAVLGFLGFLGFLGPNTGLPAPITGNDLLEYCTASLDDWETTWCHNYLIGYVEGYDTALIDAAGRDTGGEPVSQAPIGDKIDKLSSFCIPDGVIAGQMRDIVIAYLQENPAIRHWSAMLLVDNAFAEAFPCKE